MNARMVPEGDSLESIPQALRQRRQWVCWKTVSTPGERPRKVPFRPDGLHASHSNPQTWSSFDQVIGALASRHNFQGVGFVFTAADPYAGIDLDGCFATDGTLKAWAVEIVAAAQDAEAYIERSPSGLGLHLIGKGVVGHGRKRAHDAGAVELYDRDRYFTMSGEQLALGDVDRDISTVIALVRSRFGLEASGTDEAAADEAIAEVPEYLSDALAAACLEGASGDFLSFWADKIDIKSHGQDRSAHRLSLLNKIALKLTTHLGREPAAAEIRAVALRAPFIRGEIRRGKWPRLAAHECALAVQWARDNGTPRDMGPEQVQPPAEGLLVDLPALEAMSAATRWAVKGLIPADSVGFLFGASGTFKSFVALDLALSISHGLQWLGRRTVSGPAVYVAAEGGTGLWRRALAWHTKRGLDWRKTPFYVCPFPIVLGDARAAAALAAAIAERQAKPALIVVDTMSQTFAGEENSAQEVSQYLRTIGAALRARFGCSVLIVHHSGHSATERPRGSSALTANADYLYGVFRDEGEHLATLECVKIKDGERPPQLTFGLERIVLGTDEDGEEVSSLVATHIDQVAELIKAANGKATSNRAIFLSVCKHGEYERAAREQFYEQLADAPQDTRKRAWQRCMRWAVESGVLDIVRGSIVILKGDES